MRSTRDREDGAGTVLLLGVVALAVLLALAIGALGEAQRTRGAAQAAADLGALAAATAVQRGLDPCSTATAVVERNGAELAECRTEGGGAVRVTAVRAAVAPGGSFLGRASAGARAGPRPAAVRPEHRADALTRGRSHGG